jgi:large-conductance mechanosensitive channel
VTDGVCVTHGTKQSAARRWTLEVAGADTDGARLPSPVEVAVNLKKVVTWLVVAFVIFFVIQAPEQSAQLVRNAGEALGDAASQLADFVGSLV